jgi:hypothetical protein
MKEKWEYGGTVFQLFVDFKKACYFNIIKKNTETLLDDSKEGFRNVSKCLFIWEQQ